MIGIPIEKLLGNVKRKLSILNTEKNYFIFWVHYWVMGVPIIGKIKKYI